jgi:hypothetical protein
MNTPNEEISPNPEYHNEERENILNSEPLANPVAVIALPSICILDIGKQVIDIRTHCQAVLEGFMVNEARKTVARFGEQIVDPQYLRLVI